MHDGRYFDDFKQLVPAPRSKPVVHTSIEFNRRVVVVFSFKSNCSVVYKYFVCTPIDTFDFDFIITLFLDMQYKWEPIYFFYRPPNF